MQKTSGEIEKEFITALPTATGKDLRDWIELIGEQGMSKRNEIIAWLKSMHGFGHLHASLLAGILGNGGKPVYGDTTELLDNQFSKSESMRPLFEALCGFVIERFESGKLLPKKTYVSILDRREFAAVNIRNGELRLGIDLGERLFDGRVTKSKLTGPMPRISHQIVITDASQLDEELASLLQESYDRSN